MTDKQGYNPSFEKYFGLRVLLRISDDRQISGKVLHVDQFMNTVLEDAFELRPNDGVQNPLGKVILRGSNIKFWEFLDRFTGN